MVLGWGGNLLAVLHNCNDKQKNKWESIWVYPKDMVATFSFFKGKKMRLSFNTVIKGPDGERMWLRPYPQHHPHPPRLHTRWDLQPYLHSRRYLQTFTTILTLTYQVMFAHKELSPFHQSFKKGGPPFQAKLGPLLSRDGMPFYSNLDWYFWTSFP